MTIAVPVLASLPFILGFTACWTAKDNSEVIILILKRNPSLLNAVDDFGAVPLEYIPRSASDLHEKYYTLLASVAEELWGGLA